MTLLRDGASDDLVPADAVDDLLRTVRLGVEQLDVELQQARLEIVQLEVELARHVDDVQPGDARLQTAQAAIEGAAVGAQDHLTKVVAAARVHAEARVAAAEAEASWIVQAAREEVARSLVAPLGLGDPIPAATGTPEVPPAAPIAQIARWGPPPVDPPAPLLSPPPPAGVVAPPDDVPSEPEPWPEPGPESLTERAFWSHDDESPEPRRGGADLALTAVSALLVIAILAIVLAWIG